MLEIFASTGGTASGDGIFIPRADLATGGLSADSELAAAVAANIKRDKAAFAICRIINNFLSTLSSKLGVSNSSPNENSTTWSFGLTTQMFELLTDTNSLDVLPVPSTGTNTGLGDFSIDDIFPNADKVNATDAIAGAGVLILTSDIILNTNLTHAAITLAGDARKWLYGLFRWMSSADGLPTRSGTVASAVTGKSNGFPSTFTLPTAATAATNPTTDLDASDLGKFALIQLSSSLTFNIVLSIDGSGNQTWDVNSVTS